MSYLTAADVRASWLIGLTGTTEDTLIGLMIARAEAAVARFLGYPEVTPGATPTIEDTEYTRYTGDSGVFVSGRLLRLEPWPVLSVATIHDDPDEVWSSDTLVASTDYAVRRNGVHLLTGSVHGAWSDSASMNDPAIKVVFTAGFTTVPVDIVQATGMLVKHYWRLRVDQGLSGIPAGESGSAQLRDETMPSAVVELLRPYILPSRIL